MNLGEILKKWRFRVDDTKADFEWSDEEGRDFANQAQNEAAERALLLQADDQPASVTVTLSQSNGIATAHAVAHPFFSGQRLLIAGATPDDYNIAPIITVLDADNFTFHVKPTAPTPATGTITATLIAGLMCNFTTSVGKALYPLHEKIIQIRAATFDGKFISGRSRRYMDAAYPLGWLAKTGNVTDFVDTLQRQIQLFRRPTIAGAVHLTVDHYPLADMVLDTDVPEIPEKGHIHLIHWMEYLSFCKDDSERVDLPRADRAAVRFGSVFGPKVDYDVQRYQRARAPATIAMNPGW